MEYMMRCLLLSAAVAILLATGCASLHRDELAHVVRQPWDCKWMEGDLQYLADQFGTFATNSFFVGATRVRDGDLIEAHVYWKERRTLLLYWARDDDEYLRSASAISWHKEWPLESGTVDPMDNAGCYRLHLDNWIMWMQECVKKGRRFTITKRKPNRVAPTDP